MTQTDDILNIIIENPGLKLGDIIKLSGLNEKVVASRITPLVKNMRVIRRQHRYYAGGVI